MFALFCNDAIFIFAHLWLARLLVGLVSQTTCYFTICPYWLFGSEWQWTNFAILIFVFSFVEYHLRCITCRCFVVFIVGNTKVQKKQRTLMYLSIHSFFFFNAELCWFQKQPRRSNENKPRAGMKKESVFFFFEQQCNKFWRNSFKTKKKRGRGLGPQNRIWTHFFSHHPTSLFRSLFLFICLWPNDSDWFKMLLIMTICVRCVYWPSLVVLKAMRWGNKLGRCCVAWRQTIFGKITK